MEKVENLVKQVVANLNEEQEACTESQVRNLVCQIINKEASLSRLKAEIDELKKNLKELELPKPHVLEF